MSIDDIASQARQGSVAAIIQILNEKLATDGIRTRAVFDQGILQLLCEAPSVEQLEQPYVVDRVQSILEAISPRNISKVNINSRIVCEQQLLWYEEISRDPENQLLWSQLITLKRPNLVKRLLADMTAKKRPEPNFPKPSTGRKRSSQPSFWRGLIGGASLCLLAVLVAWTFKDWLQIDWRQSAANTTAPAATANPESDPDPFVVAVRLAEQAAQAGKTADVPAEWLELAAQWRRAADLMAQVPEGDPRYTTARDRVSAYRQNSDAALAKAEQLQLDEAQTSETEAQAEEVQ